MRAPESEPLWDDDPDEESDEHGGRDGHDGRDGRQLPASPAGQGPRDAGRKFELVRHVWKPKPIPPPTVDPELPSMPWPERCAEAIRYAFLAAEHWLSRHGVLREWLRLNLWVGVGLLAAALLIVPPVTMLLQGVAEWSSLVESATSNVVATVMGLPPIVIAISSVLVAARLLTRSWQRRKRRRGYHDPNDPYN